MATKVIEQVKADKVERWRMLAELATPVRQICTVSQGDGTWESALVGDDGVIIAQKIGYEDSVFLGEARDAVRLLADEVESLREYVKYVAFQRQEMVKRFGWQATCR
jgi:hypothetical protein